ncbi:unnamed protein product [Dibothriocephalus latus]|uniref:Uncharacterized protein n=1 Tax=Dibothriocephalus latus TaxID=60516 RepID=A0A3P7PFZ6_DIBLA|nr:unnamed protein product [Dibothriocephalus latus]
MISMHYGGVERKRFAAKRLSNFLLDHVVDAGVDPNMPFFAVCDQLSATLSETQSFGKATNTFFVRRL